MKYVVCLYQKIDTFIFNSIYLATLNDVKTFELAISNLQTTLFAMGLNPVVQLHGDAQFTYANIYY